MIRKILFAIIIAIPSASTAQVIFQPLSLSEAIEKAASTNKIVFAQFTSATSERTNEMAEEAFESKELGDKVAKDFVAIKIDVSSKDRQKFIEDYNPEETAGTYFITGDGELLYRMAGTSTMHKVYAQIMTSARDKLVEGRVTFSELDREWNENPENFAAMEKNLQKRLSLGYVTDSLLDIYVSRLPEDSLLSTRVIKFVLYHAPLPLSLAKKRIRRNKMIFDSAWKQIPGPTQNAINTKMAKKDMKNAIVLKSDSMALRAATAFSKTYKTTNPKMRRERFERQMLYYYLGIKDTASYVLLAVPYCDTFYMPFSASELSRQDSTRRQSLLAVYLKDSSNMQAETIAALRKSVLTSKPVTQTTATTLNNIAWVVYMYSKDTVYLNKALTWAKKALDIYPTSYITDTYARLLYKTGNRKDAITYQEQAVKLIKNNKYDLNHYQQIFEKMKKGESKIDKSN